MRQTARHLRGEETLQLVDIAVPRDIDPCVSSIPGVHLTDIDDIQAVVDESLAMRSHYMEPAERIIGDQIESFTGWMSTRSVSNSIQLLRDRADAIRATRAGLGDFPNFPTSRRASWMMVAQLSNRLVKKLLHTPTLKLREAAAKGESEPVSELVHQLFELNGELEPTIKTDRVTHETDEFRATVHQVPGPHSRRGEQSGQVLLARRRHAARS